MASLKKHTVDYLNCKYQPARETASETASERASETAIICVEKISILSSLL